MILTCIAVTSWCLSALMLPVVAGIVWLRRRADPAVIIQEDDVDDIL